METYWYNEKNEVVVLVKMGDQRLNRSAAQCNCDLAERHWREAAEQYRPLLEDQLSCSIDTNPEEKAVISIFPSQLQEEILQDSVDLERYECTWNSAPHFRSLRQYFQTWQINIAEQQAVRADAIIFF